MNSQGSVYSIKPFMGRLLSGAAVKLFLLGILFYLAIIFNLTLMEIEFPMQLHVVILFLLASLVAAQLIINYHNNVHLQYVFYNSYIEIVGLRKPTGNERIYFYNIKNITVKENIFDKILGTVTLELSPDFSLIAVKDGKKMYDYIMRMIQYNAQYYQQNVQQ